MIRALSPQSLENFIIAINKCWNKNEILSSWRRIKIIPILKKNRNPANVESPISLISVSVKLINLMVKERLVCFLDVNNILAQRTFAYRKDLSAGMCLNEFTHLVASLKSKAYKVVVCSLDINKAYDCVDLRKLQQIFELNHIPTELSSWTLNFFSKRTLLLGNEEISVSGGIPQGSVLSPTIFNLYTKSLHTLEDEKTSIFQYADDFLIVSFAKQFDDAVENLAQKMRYFRIKCNNLNLSFNLEKTHSMYIAQGSNKVIDININGTLITQVNSLKFIGRDLNTSLTFVDHYDRVCHESLSNSNAIKMMTSFKSGLTPYVSLNLYKSLVRSKIEFVRTTTCHSANYINNRIRTFQNQHLRRCLGLTKSCPIQIVYFLSGELPPQERALLLTAKEIIKIIFNNPDLFQNIKSNCEVKSSYAFCYSYFRDIFDRIGLSVTTVSNTKTTLVLDVLAGLGAKKDISPDMIRPLYTECLDWYKNNNYYILATDGSVGNASSGVGIYNHSGNRSISLRIDEIVSSLTTELIAIRSAVRIAIKLGLDRIVIFTDSLVSCKLLKNNSTNNFIVGQIIKSIESSRLVSCHFVWVPSHVGFQINERADEAAKVGLTSNNIIEIQYTPKEAINKIKNILKQKFLDYYKNQSLHTGKFFFSIFPDLLAKPWFHKSSLSSSDIKLMNRLLSGHTYDKCFLYRIKIVNTDICDICNVREDSNHLIFHCKKYDIFRSKYKFFLDFSNLKD